MRQCLLRRKHSLPEIYIARLETHVSRNLLWRKIFDLVLTEKETETHNTQRERGRAWEKWGGGGGGGGGGEGEIEREAV